MIGIVIVAHGALAHEFLKAVEHVVGEQPAIRTISIEANYDKLAKVHEISTAADAVDQGAGVVVVTDLHGGSPSNLSLPACRAQDRRIISGANLPMLIKLAKSRQKPMAEAIAAALDAGRKYIDAQRLSIDI